MADYRINGLPQYPTSSYPSDAKVELDTGTDEAYGFSATVSQLNGTAEAPVPTVTAKKIALSDATSSSIGFGEVIYSPPDMQGRYVGMRPGVGFSLLDYNDDDVDTYLSGERSKTITKASMNQIDADKLSATNFKLGNFTDTKSPGSQWYDGRFRGQNGSTSVPLDYNSADFTTDYNARLGVANGAASLRANGQLTLSQFPTDITSDYVQPGTTNLYFTNARAQAAIQGTSPTFATVNAANINLGSTAGSKLLVFSSGSNYMGFGVSNKQFNTFFPTTNDLVYYIGGSNNDGTEVARLNVSGFTAPNVYTSLLRQVLPTSEPANSEFSANGQARAYIDTGAIKLKVRTNSTTFTIYTLSGTASYTDAQARAALAQANNNFIIGANSTIYGDLVAGQIGLSLPPSADDTVYVSYRQTGTGTLISKPWLRKYDLNRDESIFISPRDVQLYETGVVGANVNWPMLYDSSGVYAQRDPSSSAFTSVIMLNLPCNINNLSTPTRITSIDFYWAILSAAFSGAHTMTLKEYNYSSGSVSTIFTQTLSGSITSRTSYRKTLNYDVVTGCVYVLEIAGAPASLSKYCLYGVQVTCTRVFELPPPS